MSQSFPPDGQEQFGQQVDNGGSVDRREESESRKFRRSVLLAAIAICVILTALLVAGLGGAVAGQNERRLQATETTRADISLQYQLGLADLSAGNYTMAEQRFEWILQLDPQYPGAAERLAEARQAMSQGTLPPVTSTPSPLPPSDTASLDDLFAEAEQYVADRQWEAAISRLEAVQARDRTYREVDVKELLYQALSTLGLIYVRGDRLEEGVVLLEQARTIRPLDDQAEGELLLANLYITGLTYWNLNWPIAVDNLEAVYAVAPAYRDVFDRLVQAHVLFGDQLVEIGTPCEAAEQYEASLVYQFDAEVNDKYEQAAYNCLNPSPTPTPTQDFDGAPPPTGEPEGTPTPLP
jgi:tetratricopeptide (TPR) repeat protein